MNDELRFDPTGLIFMEHIGDWQWAQNYIYPVLRTVKADDRKSAEQVSMNFLDLKVYFIVRYPVNEEETASVIITDMMLAVWNKTRTELLETAKKNLRDDGYYIRDLNKVCQMMLGMEVDWEEDDPGAKLYVVCNCRKFNGASALLYTSFLRDFAEKKQADLYIIPSSIHELILALDDGKMDDEEFRDMITEVNEDIVAEDERLSNHAYYYSRSADRIFCQKEERRL